MNSLSSPTGPAEHWAGGSRAKSFNSWDKQMTSQFVNPCKMVHHVKYFFYIKFNLDNIKKTQQQGKHKSITHKTLEKITFHNT